MEGLGDTAGPATLAAAANEAVRVPKAAFQQTIQVMKMQKEQIKELQRQLKAGENVQILLRQKEEELTVCQQKLAQLQADQQRSDARLNSRICQQNARQSTTSEAEDREHSDLEEDGDGSCMEYANPPFSNPVNKMPAVFPPNRTAFSHSVLPAQLTFVPSSSVVPPSSSANSAMCSTAAASAASPTVLSFPSTASAMHQFVSFGGASESKDLVDKLVHQNARLRKAIREILSQRGMTVSDYLDKQEYEDAAEILRQELKRVQSLVNELKSIISSRNASDVDQLANKCAQAEEKASQLERKNGLLKAYADAMRHSNDKLKQEKQEQTLRRPSSESSPAPSPLFVAAPSVSSEDYAKIMSDLKKLKDDCELANVAKKHLMGQIEALKSQLEISKRDCETLRRNEDQLLELQNKYDKMSEEFALIQSQAAVFHEDFQMERKEKLDLKRQVDEIQKLKKHFEVMYTQEVQKGIEKQKKYESTLAKHQDWIRRLAEEAQTLRVSWEQARNEKEMLERCVKTSPPLYSTCSPVAGNFQQFRTPLVGGRDISEDGPSHGSDNESENLVCRRCEREFRPSEREKYNQHCKRCME